MYVSYLSMGFLDIGIKKTSRAASARESLIAPKDGDCVTSHGLTAYHLFLGSYFEATLTTGMAQTRDIYLNLSEISQLQQQLEHLSVICPFFEEKFG